MGKAEIDLILQYMWTNQIAESQGVPLTWLPAFKGAVSLKIRYKSTID
jgi:hypothetical protein